MRPSLRAWRLLLLPLLAVACGTGSASTSSPAAPTTVPTIVPPTTPTAVPTTIPTIAPTVAPTVAPTAAPTLAPTVAPRPAASAVVVARSTAPTTGPRITSAVIARGVQDAQPLEPTATFHAGATDIYLFVSVADATPSTSIHVQWIPLNAPEYTGNSPIDTGFDNVQGSTTMWWLFHRDDALPAGQYAAEVRLNDAAPQRVPFTILSAAPPVFGRPGASLPGAPPPSLPGAQPTNLEFVLDASGSMNEPVGDLTKMEAAHAALHALVGALPTDAGLNVGLRAYSNRLVGADKAQVCQDTQLQVPVQGVDKDQLDAQIDAIQAVGDYTPMAYAVQQAARDFPPGRGQNVVVLVSDGKENCQADPAAIIKAAAAPLGLVVDVVGFDVQADAEAQAQLKAIAAATGGTYADARSLDELNAALRKLAAEQVKIIPPQSGPGQLTLGVIPGATLGWLQIRGSNGKVVDDSNPKGQYQLPAGLYDVEIHPVIGNSNAWFRVEIASNRESVVPLGGVALTSRTPPAEFAIEDQDASRRVADSSSLPQQPFLLPPGRYTIQVKQSLGADWQTVLRDVQVQPNTIVEVSL